MADAIIDMVGPEELPVISQLYNQIFRPPRDVESFIRRYRGRYNVLQLIARLDNRPVGFFLGFELKPTVFFAWFYGVIPDFRRQGIASLLMRRLFDLTSGRSRRGYTLEVRVSNAGAIKLYERLGFRPRGVRRGYYTDNREDALIMWKDPVVRDFVAND